MKRQQRQVHSLLSNTSSETNSSFYDSLFDKKIELATAGFDMVGTFLIMDVDLELILFQQHNL